MRTVARVAAETAMLLGTPAQVEGNLIRVTNGLVGVNEACSGIRSLQTSIMIGLLFGEVKRLAVLRRLALVVCAVVIALFANFIRAIFLVQVAATENLSEVSRWHDIAGYTIILFVFLVTMGLAYLLGRKRTAVVASVPPVESGRSATDFALRSQPARLPPQLPVVYIAAALCWLVVVEIGTAGWYRLHERNLVSGIRWNVQWAEQAPNFRKLKIDNEIRAVLRFDEGDAAAWTNSSPVNATDPKTITCSLYVFRWNPGKNSALLANLHRPDVCLPASGWKQVADHGVRSYPIGSSVELPFRHFEFERAFDGSTTQTAHAFYCLSEDRLGEASTSLAGADSPGMFGNRSEWTRTERLGAVLQGRRHLGQQVIEAIFISNEPLSAADAETHLRYFIRDVVRLREAD
jgi:exosortase/archaeosortase family protein